MDKIWDGNPLKTEVIGCCGGNEKKTIDHAEKTRLNGEKTLCMDKDIPAIMRMDLMYSYMASISTVWQTSTIYKVSLIRPPMLYCEPAIEM